MKSLTWEKEKSKKLKSSNEIQRYNSLEKEQESKKTMYLYLEPDRYLLEKAKEEKEIEYRKALEIYLATHLSSVNYEDLMKDLPDGTVSKQQFLSWFNDSVRKNKVVRKGILTNYRESKPEHFDENGHWNIKYFHAYIQFVFQSLTDPTIVHDKKVFEKFVYSVNNDEWKFKAMLVAGLKMLEDLYIKNQLQSTIARNLISEIYLIRDERTEIAKILMRTVNYAIKEGTVGEELAEVLKDNLFEIMEEQTKRRLRMGIEYHREIAKEYDVYLLFEPEIKKQIQQVFEEVSQPKFLLE